ncbi:autotransporter outer membrane beta-barrel domain-containing protein [Chachezhania antarctica]|mgnify:CR=1 FL=1|uniref:autotransporter outer membrane beta-barrel domain-containing protein n=1 Tax=Chachezhania antarctica TaxID=2340860 RepID=UPI000EB392C3|nr:autotransporter outer membrane beta-barrel domain-containing protein [Chachezhania antarctica]
MSTRDAFSPPSLKGKSSNMAGRSGPLLAASGLILVGWAGVAAGEIVAPPSQGGVNTPDGDMPRVTSTVSGGGIVPVILETDNDWSIIGQITGALSLDGLPTVDPSNGVVQYLSTGSTPQATETAFDAGDITVTMGTPTGSAGTDSLSATGITGGGPVPGALWVGSVGTDGYLAPGQDNWQNNDIDNFTQGAVDGSDAGAIIVTIDGSAALSATGQGASKGGALGTPALSGVTVTSIGGHATSATDADENAFVGNGGDAGDINLTTEAGSTIIVDAGGDGGATGIYAYAQGGALGQAQNYYTGTPGTAGTVAVTHGGSITVSDPDGFGIYAAAVGGDGFENEATVLPTGNGYPADGGAVSVTLGSDASITMGQGGVGIFGFSRAGSWEPFGSTFQPSGGTVAITLDDGASIRTGTGKGADFAMGALAISAGNALVEKRGDNGEGSGNAGSITIDNAGDIATGGTLSFGLAALAVGGTPFVTSVNSGSNVIGNSGEIASADGGSINVGHSGTITTPGDHAAGILALSSGGGGVVKNDAAGVVNSDGTGFSAGTLLGANTNSDAAATSGGSVEIDVSGTIATGGTAGSGIGAFGILAQSIGGSGGMAGGSESLTAIGDAGGGGGAGGKVTVSLDDGTRIGTLGKNAHGLLAQSIGGGGGSGVSSSGGFVAVGGAGGAGGDGGTATLNTAGSVQITTAANYSHGAVVQSIGGGGGNGGYADSAGAFVDVAIGGAGGAGGSGGVAGGYNNAGSRVTTVGNHAYGMTVQSIGGGGGVGGAAMSYAAGALFSASFAVGGKGGVGGDGGVVTGINHGTISTGLNPATLASGVTFVAGTGTVYGTLSNGATFVGDFTSGGIEDGVVAGDLGTLTIRDGDQTRTIQNASMDDGVLTGAGFSGTVMSGGILQAVASDPGTALVSGVLSDGLFTAATGAPNPNGADAAGMVVQSIGGGGGAGGSATGKALALPLAGGGEYELKQFAFAGSLGANGGAAGDGGGVTAGNYNAILTWGDAARGVVAQSIGGGGGIGGDATATSTTIQDSGTDFQASFALGGYGGASGNGGTVTAFNGAEDGSEIGSVITHGQFATGILAQSIGGGGGAGGTGTATNNTPDVPYATGNSYAGDLGLGGFGGAGGNGGTVTVYNYAGSSSATTGSDATAIRAQSIGGGGGEGVGGSGGVSATVSNTPLSMKVNVGAVNGDAGDGDAVTVDNYGFISTMGGGSHGIHAQSVGGGGGAAGSLDSRSSAFLKSVAGDVKSWLSDDGSYRALISLGGSAGDGGDGDMVTVLNDATAGIATNGERALGILAQSIGGGGGTAGASSGLSRSAVTSTTTQDGARVFTTTLDIGSGSGSTGQGGTVDVTNNGQIVTTGSGATALVAQSVSNGGYGAAASVDGDLTLAMGLSVNTDVISSALDGGDVGVIHSADASITTAGRDAAAIIAQSVGGGGGIASAGSDAFQTVGGGQAGSAFHKITLGGTYSDSAPPNVGGTVSVTASGDIATTADWSHGVVAQSVGGGGGSAAVHTTDSVAASLDVVVGATGGTGNGGDVTVALGSTGGPASITTGTQTTTGGTTTRTGYAAYGILAQSIGGGGGLVMEDTAAGTQAFGTIMLGGNGIGNGTKVSVTGDASVTTHGDTAHGVVLQSIGMGGGIAGQGSSLTPDSPAATGAVLASLNPLAAAPAYGNGGNVTLDSALTISTSGASAYGVLAQSIGGGGGLAFSQNAANIATIGNAFGTGTKSNGGNLRLTLQDGTAIATTGAAAHAIVAQSIGGGGGILGYHNGSGFSFPTEITNTQVGDGNSVNITTNGTITTSGDGAHGILAQSIGGGGGLFAQDGTAYAGSVGGGTSRGGGITINQSGTLAATGADASGIFAQSTRGSDGPASMNIDIAGAVSGGSGTGYGVWMDGGSFNTLTIDATGSLSALSGNAIYVTGGSSTTVANAGTLFGNALISGGTLTNTGIYDVGNGATVDGFYRQSDTGTLRFSFTSDPSAKLIVAGSAVLQGSADPVVGDWLLPVGNVLIQGEPVELDGPVTTPSGPLYSWTIGQPGPTSVTITPVADFTGAASGLDGNEQQAAGYLQDEWTAQNAAMASYFADLYNTVATQGQYQTVLDDMSPEATQALATNLANVSDSILGAAMSCPAFEGTTTLLTEGSCIWAQSGGDITRRFDADSRVSRVVTSFGGQKELDNGWALGGTFGFAALNAKGNTYSGSGTDYYGSVALKRVVGPWTFAGALAGGVGDYSINRVVQTDGSSLTAEPDAYLVGARARVAYDFAYKNSYIRPTMDLDLTYLNTATYRESGTSAFALAVDESDQVNAVFAPSVEFGFRRNMADDFILRGYVSGGAAFAARDGRSVSAALIGATSDNAFRVNIDTPNVLGTFTAGLQLYQDKGWDVRGEYRLQAGGDFLNQGGLLRLSYRF